ncbi:hypothetical protein AAZX31_12G124300 [Glycine max]
MFSTCVLLLVSLGWKEEWMCSRSGHLEDHGKRGKRQIKVAFQLPDQWNLTFLRKLVGQELSCFKSLADEHLEESEALYLNCPQLNDLNLNSCRNLHPGSHFTPCSIAIISQKFDATLQIIQYCAVELARIRGAAKKHLCLN